MKLNDKEQLKWQKEIILEELRESLSQEYKLEQYMDKTEYETNANR